MQCVCRRTKCMYEVDDWAISVVAGRTDGLTGPRSYGLSLVACVLAGAIVLIVPNDSGCLFSKSPTTFQCLGISCVIYIDRTPYYREFVGQLYVSCESLTWWAVCSVLHIYIQSHSHSITTAMDSAKGLNKSGRYESSTSLSVRRRLCSNDRRRTFACILLLTEILAVSAVFAACCAYARWGHGRGCSLCCGCLCARQKKL